MQTFYVASCYQYIRQKKIPDIDEYRIFLMENRYLFVNERRSLPAEHDELKE
jgi:hypothetical protein